MYLLYLDGSGGADWPPPIGKSPTKFYVLAGLAIQPENWESAYNQVNDLISNYFPNPSKRPEELHYTHLIARKGPYGLLSNDQRRELADGVFKIAKSINPTLFAIVVDKMAHYNKYKTPEPPKQLAFRFIAPHFSKFLDRKNETGIMIYDTEQARSDMFLRQFLETARKSGIVLQTWVPSYDPYRTQNRLDKVVESIFFLESHLSPIIQLADFCSYAIFSKYEHKKDQRFNEIYDLFDNDNGKPWGLIVWPR